jgi:hypothetical protein
VHIGGKDKEKATIILNSPSNITEKCSLLIIALGF